MYVKNEPQLDAREAVTAAASSKNFRNAAAPEGCGICKFHTFKDKSVVSSKVTCELWKSR
jgi:hypothetical protein